MQGLDPTTDAENVARRVINELEAVIRSCEESHQPLELDPARSELFGLFVLAERAGLTVEDATPDLTADGLCHHFASRWGLRAAAQQSVTQQGAIPPDQLTKMRSLWSVMRMWMEWTYAWERWSEFHGSSGRSGGS